MWPKQTTKPCTMENDIPLVLQRLIDIEKKTVTMEKVVEQNTESIDTLFDIQFQSSSYVGAAKREIPCPSPTMSVGHQSICPLPLKISLLHPCVYCWSEYAADTAAAKHACFHRWSTHPNHQWQWVCGSGPESAAQWHAAQWAAIWQTEPRGRRDRDRRTVYGTHQHGTLKSVSNTTSLFVFRVDIGVSEDDIKTYLSGKILTDTFVQCVSYTDTRAKSFRVNVNNKDKDKVMSPDFWPDGMACRLFMRNQIMMPIAHRCRETLLMVHDGGF